ncbi:hypothetical protein AB833_31875 [Chromatiales bacterium (ex Bugula neritina AB1)]|nr:hypothetical protein AB833_31875 [Chromatiales bacterium (ex Bugula neritina AB1)]
MSPSHRILLAQLLVFITPAFWSANYIVARAGIGVIEPHMLAFLRWLFAFCLMLPFALPELRRHWPVWRREWKDFLLMGALGMWICGAFVYIGGQTTEALNIGLIYASAPVAIAVISARLFSERLHGWQIVGSVLSISGALLIIARGSWQNLISVQFTHGDIWIVVAVISWTTYSILLKHRQSVLGTFARLTIITFGGVIVLAPLTAIEYLYAGGPDDWSIALWLSVVVAVLPGFGAYQAYSFMQKELGAARAGQVLYLGPLYTALIAWWLLSEPPFWFHLAGAMLILPGMYLATRYSDKG